MKIVSGSSASALNRYLAGATRSSVCVWPEMNPFTGEVYHPQEMIRRVEKWIREDRVCICTMSEIPILTACRMMRLGQLPEGVRIELIWVGEDGIPVEVDLSQKGELLSPWPDPSPYNLFEAGFYLRFDDGN